MPPIDEPEHTARWRASFAACAPTLEALAAASDESGRLAARAWWVVCMGKQCAGCELPYRAWREDAAQALPSQLTAEHTEAAIALPSWSPLAQCVIDHGRAVGVEVSRTLDAVEKAGVERQAHGEWSRAVAEVAPLRARLQKQFLPAGLARSTGAMDIDELRVCQVWMYGLASRLRDCSERAREFSRAAHMRDPNSPLLGYDAARWDPRADSWAAMELCVHEQAAKAGVEADAAWRQPL